MTASENIRQILEVGYNGNDEQTTALGMALDLLEKKEKAERVADKLGRLLCDEYDYWNSNEGIKDRKEAQRLLDLKAEGRIIELPVPIGSEHYYIARDRRRGIKKVKVCGIWTSCKVDCSHMLIADVDGTFSSQCDFDEIGVRLFSTREEAEARLVELRGE